MSWRLPGPRRPILLANELGRGFGHAYKLLLVARGLAAAGERPVLVLPDPETTRALGGDFEVLTAPPLERAAVPPAFESMGDILAAAGLGDVAATGTVMQRWEDILARVQPALVIGDYAPFLSVAAYGRLPRMALGNGFTLPPANLAGYPSFSGERVLRHPAVDRTLDELVGPDRPVTPALLAGERHFVCVLPELDVFAGLRRHPAVGPLEDPPRLSPVLDRSFFAYLAGSAPGCEVVLAGLARSGCRGSVHVRGGTAAQARSLAGSAVRWCPRPVSLDDAIHESALIVHHGGPNTAQRALLAGRPQLLAPDTVEQVLDAEELEGLGVGRCLGSEVSPDEVAEAIVAMTGAPWVQRANERGREIGRRFPRGRCADVVAAVQSLIA